MKIIEHSQSTIGKEEEKAVVEVIRSNYLSEGEIVHNFEKELSNYIGSKGAVATSTGTLALHLGLLSLNLKKNDEIIAPSYVCRSVLNAILYAGAKPVLCDVNKEDFNISLKSAEKNITKKTKAIIVPHMFGSPAEIDKFKGFGLYIIEDCAHAIGAKYKGRKVGSWGDLAVFSFEGTKYIIAGEGGMILANSKLLLNRLQNLKIPDSLDRRIKYTYRMTNLQAAIGRVQLTKLNHFIKKRREIAKIYHQALANNDIELPQEYSGRYHIFHRYMLKIKSNIYAFMKKCYQQGIKVKQPVKPCSLHRYLNLPNRNFPNTEYIMRSAVSIPIYPTLSDEQIKYIIAVVKKHLPA